MSRLCIIGPGRSGKDTVAEWLGKNTEHTYIGGTSWFAAEYMFTYMTENGFKYRTVEECWNDRIYHRELWAKIIDEHINKPDPCRLYKDCLKRQSILTGIRREREYESLYENFPDILTIWVERDVPIDPTLELTADHADIIILNNESLDRLYEKLKNLSRHLCQ